MSRVRTVFRAGFVACITFVGFSSSLLLGCGSNSGGTSTTTRDFTNYYPITSSCSAPTTPSYSVAANVQYSTASTNDYVAVYTPTTGTNWPLLVWVHGGGWGNTGLLYNNAYTLNEIAPFLSQGYAVASVDYRMSAGLSNPATMPAQIQDVRCSIMWLRANAATYHYSTTNLIAMGESAGGQLAGMLAMNLANGSGFDDTVNCGSWAGGAGNATVRAAVLWYPAVDLRSSSLLMTTPISGLSCTNARTCANAVLGATPENAPTLASSVSPITRLSASTVPILVNTGSADSLLSVDMSRNFVSTAAAFGSRITYVELTGLDHGFFGSDYSNYWNMTGTNASQYAKSVCTTLNFISKTSQGL